MRETIVYPFLKKSGKIIGISTIVAASIVANKQDSEVSKPYFRTSDITSIDLASFEQPVELTESLLTEQIIPSDIPVEVEQAPPENMMTEIVTADVPVETEQAPPPSPPVLQPTPNLKPAPAQPTPKPTPQPKPITGSTESNPTTGNVQEKLTNATLSAFGSNQTSSMMTLILKESGFNPYGINPKSGACGIPQALPCEKLLNECGSLGNVDCQISWLINYIASRYGTPANALEHQNRYGWY